MANVGVSLDIESIKTKEDAYEDEMLDGVGFFQPSKDRKTKLMCWWNKLFLDSCATNNTMFALEDLEGIHNTKIFLRQRFTNTMSYWHGYKFWVKEDGIANLFVKIDQFHDIDNHPVILSKWLFKFEVSREVEKAVCTQNMYPNFFGN